MASVMRIQHQPERFGEWLRSECERVGIATHKELHRAIVRNVDSFSDSEKTVERWFKGSHSPRDDSPILTTLASLGSAEVFARYEAYLEEEFRRFRSFHLSPAQGGSGANELRGRDSNPQPSGIKPRIAA